MMSKLLPSGHCRLALQLCAAVAVAALMSGCSADSTRLGDPFGNPFGSASNDTGAAPRHVASAGDVIPAGRMPPVSSRALAPQAVAAAPAYPAAPKVAFREPVSRETTGSIEPAPARMASGNGAAGWTATGGTPLQVADGETAAILAQRYGVPASALLQANGLRSAADVRPGTRITIPVYSATGARAPRIAEAAPVAEPRRPAPMTAPAPRAPVLAERPTPVRTATEVTPKASAAPVTRQAAAHPTPKPVAVAKTETPVEPKKRAPAKEAVAAKEIVAPKPVAAVKTVPVKAASIKAPPSQPVAVATAPAKTNVKTAALVAPKPAEKAEAPKAAVVDPAPTASIAPAAPAAPAVAGADGTPEFRWPARGRIIQSFKGGSGGNDGINIAVPEGTSVRAAEGGVVAYAGSELKGYGNLVLIRHPNGFVSAYANNGQIDVKRGETVKRGQEIAKSGQSGNVSSPQLHFELRKGSTPVDPTQFLAGL